MFSFFKRLTELENRVVALEESFFISTTAIGFEVPTNEELEERARIRCQSNKEAKAND